MVGDDRAELERERVERSPRIRAPASTSGVASPASCHAATRPAQARRSSAVSVSTDHQRLHRRGAVAMRVAVFLLRVRRAPALAMRDERLQPRAEDVAQFVFERLDCRREIFITPL